MSRTDGVQLMVLCFTNFLYHLNTISGMKSRLERLERLHTSEFCLSRWQYLRKQIYFITNVLSRQKGKKWKIISWKIFCSIAFVMAIFSPIIIPMFWDTPVPKTHRAIKKILCFWLICFCDVRKKPLLFQTVFSFSFGWLGKRNVNRVPRNPQSENRTFKDEILRD